MSDTAKSIASLKNSLYVVCEIDSNETIISVSASSRQLWGFSAEELAGKWFGTLIVPEDAGAAIGAIKGARHGKQIEPFECRIVRTDGSICTMQWSVEHQSDRDRVLCIAHDITERKKIEERLRMAEAQSRLIIESMPVGLVICDLDGKIDLLNPHAETMLGKDLRSVLGKNVHDLFHHKTAAESPDKFIARIAAANAIELELACADGSGLPVEVTVNPFAGLEGLRYVVSLVDVSDRREIENLKRELVSLISHDLGGPLTAVQGMMEMLEEGVFGDLNEATLKAVSLAHEEVVRMIGLINGLVGVTKSTFGTNQLRPEPMFLSAVMAKSIQKISKSAESKRLTFLLPQLNPRCNIDPERVSEVFATFLSKAIDRSEDGGSIQIATRMNDADHFGLRIRATAPRELPAPQVKSDSSQSEAQRAAAETIAQRKNVLGIAICRAVIEHHGGSLDVYDESTGDFILSLPIAKD